MVDLSKVRVMLAPMEGVVDSIMRDVLTRIGGVDLCVTEFIRVTDQILPDHVLFRYAPELSHGSRTASGVPLLVQFLGSNPDMLAANAVRAVELGAYGIDLNFGCPAKTVNRHDGGASLLKDPERIFKIVSCVRRAVRSDISVSAKIRLGFHDKSQFLEIASSVESAGANFLTVHARTRDEGYTPPAHWEYIANIKNALKIPVIANGEIWSLDDFRKCRDVTGCSTFMLGRGLIANPKLATQIQQDSSDAHDWPFILEHFRDFVSKSSVRSPTYAVSRAKQWSKQFGRNYPEGARLFETIKLCQDFESLNALI